MLVTGFIIASKLTDVVGGFLMQAYPVMIANVQMNSFTGFFSIILYLIFFGVLSVSVINSCMSVMYIIPEAIWHFMGANVSQTTQVGRDTARTTENFVKGVVGSEFMRGGGGNNGGNKKPNKQGVGPGTAPTGFSSPGFGIGSTTHTFNGIGGANAPKKRKEYE